MNIEKVYTALQEDQMNTGLGIVCAEFETQGYEVEIEGLQVTAKEIFGNKFPSLEEVLIPLNIKLLKNGISEQQFSIEFVDYHKIIFREYIKDRRDYERQK